MGLIQAAVALHISCAVLALATLGQWSAVGVITVTAAAGTVTEDQAARGAAAPKHVHDSRENALEYITVANTKEDYLAEEFLTLSVNTTLLGESGDWVEVSWTGTYTPSYWDYVALIVPSDADVRTTAPAKYKQCRDAILDSDLRPKLRFRALNFRQPFRFVLFRNGLTYPVAIAKSPEVGFVNYNEPTQGHLALTNHPGEMTVQWVTRDTGSPEVAWGTSPDRLASSTVASSSTYKKSDLCGEPATSVGWVSPGMMHAATLTDLQPDTRYFYQHGDQKLGLSPIRSFVTPPRVGPDSEVRLLHVADMGQAEMDGSNELSMMAPSLNTTALMAADMARAPYRLVIHNGDISYARGYVTQWDVFYDQIQPLATQVPWMTSVGNHERDHPFSGDRFDMAFDSGGECGVPYELRTGMPHPRRGQQWYSFDYGPIHFLQISTEQPFAPGSDQHQFIVDDLQRADRSMTPLEGGPLYDAVADRGGHRPFYVSSTYDGPKDSDIGVAAELRHALEDLFLAHRVDMVWTGHHHSYQRTCPIHRSRCVEAAVEGG
eukprot:CAMPEP_0177794908 /NCGR_PEP_ID=MMETSP0491_2-20121128/25918_1 /TAXON_ID=63592 /ORGANISM="Tetraselmis chuii, Strain PLY429" /LENGTH=546 /DNA_ID=CAMNT_0019317639 /DNA_START=179 /DNA_END=1817 /DNA_ORIENTATION=-